MQEATEATPLERARAAAATGDWQDAYELLSEVDARTTLVGPDLALLAGAAYAAGHFDVTIEAWERVHKASVQAGDHLAAAGAAVRVAMHLLFDMALMAPVRAWLTRADRLLEDHQEDTSVHAWLAVVRNYERLLSGDFENARHWARRAIEAGTGHDPAAAAIGRVAEARSLILQGDVTRGLALLNEAAAAAVAGELDPLWTGLVTARWCVRSKRSGNTTSRRSGRPRWRAGGTGSRLGVSTDAVVSTGRKSSGFVGAAPTRRRRSSWHARNCVRTYDGSSAGR